MNSERKPTALDEAINLAAELVCTADTQDARAEVRVLRELAEAYMDEADNPIDDRPGGSVVRLLDARIAYRQWRAEQEK